MNSEIQEYEFGEDNRGPTMQWVTFKLDDEAYGVNVLQVQEVLKNADIAPVPGAPDFVLGIINLRGNVVTIIDTRKRFALTPKEMDEDSRIIIIEAEGQTVGIVVDSVAEVVEVEESQIDTAPSVGNEETSRYIEGVVSRGDSLMILVDLNRLLTLEEWNEVATL